MPLKCRQILKPLPRLLARGICRIVCSGNWFDRLFYGSVRLSPSEFSDFKNVVTRPARGITVALLALPLVQMNGVKVVHIGSRTWAKIEFGAFRECSIRRRTKENLV